MQFDFTQLLDYLQSLGRRRAAIGRASLGYAGEGLYPIVVVEPDPLCAESTAGLLTYDVALLVLDRERDATGEYRPDPGQVPGLLARTGQWCDELVEMLHHEHPGDVVKGSYSRVAIPAGVGGDLATGWRVELRLQVRQYLNRNTNAALFTAE